MTHLTPEEFTDLVDGVLPADRHGHLTGCPACRERADALRVTLQAAASNDVPEPSPLFWDHFSARVAEAIRREPRAAQGWARWMRTPAIAWASVAAAVVLVLAAVAWRQGGRDTAASAGQVPAVAHRQSPTAAVAEKDLQIAAADAEPDEAWALVRTVAEDVAWDDAHAAGITARPGAAEGLAVELSAEERAELARLLETELKRAGV